ncbi:hypothetical protein [Enterococcus olivae]
MENRRKPCDAERFFKDMPRNLQLEAIRQLERQKKPPDSIELLYRSQQREWEYFKAHRAERTADLTISQLVR